MVQAAARGVFTMLSLAALLYSYGNTTAYKYNGNGRLAKATDPDVSTRRYTYDFRGNLASKADGRGMTTYYYCDSMKQQVFTLLVYRISM
nr:RHS repeat domain-containing protein [Anaerobacterium chartisolvens]